MTLLNPTLLVAWVLAQSGNVTTYGQSHDGACMDCSLASRRTTVASSELRGKTFEHPASLAADGRMDTAWCEGAKGPGVGQWIELDLGAPQRVSAVRVHGGYFKSAGLLAQNARLRRVSVLLDGVRVGSFELGDPTRASDVGEGFELPEAPTAEDIFQIARSGPATLWLDSPVAQKPARRIRLTVDAVYPGTRYPDLCVSELGAYLAAPAPSEEAEAAEPPEIEP